MTAGMIYSGMDSFYLGYYPLYMTKISLMLSVKVFLVDNLTHLCTKHTEESVFNFSDINVPDQHLLILALIILRLQLTGSNKVIF